MEASKLSDTKVKTMFIRMLEEFSEHISSIKKDMETIKRNYSEMKATQPK